MKGEVDGVNIKIKQRAIALFIVVSMCVRYYYLVDYEDSFLGIQLPHIAVFTALVWGFMIWIRLTKRPDIRFPYATLMLFFVFLAILSAFQAYRLYEQDFFTGFFAQYFIIAWALLYYPISKYVYYGKFSTGNIKKMIKVVGTIQLIVFIGQYILADIFRFTYVNEAVRYGEVKFYFSPVLLDLLLFFEFDNFVQNRDKMGLCGKIASLGYMVAVLFVVMVVIKYRLTTAGLLLCLAVGVLLGKSSIKKKTVYFILAIIGGLFLLNTTMVQDILNEVLRGQTYTGGISTLSARELGRAFCFDTFFKHPFLGGGSIGLAISTEGAAQNIYLGDYGFAGFLFIYGGLGILWTLMLWVMMLKYGWVIYRKKGQLAYMLYPLFFLITGVNEIHWYENYGFMVLVLFLVIQQNELKDCMKATDTDRRKRYRRVERRSMYRGTD